MSKFATPYVLKCGEHLLGEISLDDAEMWHNEGILAPGPDLPRYQAIFADYRRLAGEYEAAATDEATAAASEERDAAADRIDQLGLYLVEVETGQAMPIEDFHPLDESGRVYWRFKDDGSSLQRDGLRDWAVFALIMAALPFTFVYLFACWATRKCRLFRRCSGSEPRV